MHRVTSWAPVGFGLATIAMLPLISPLISGTHAAVYHLDGSASSIFLAVTFDYLALAAIVGGLLYWSERSAVRRRLVWGVLIAAMPLFLLKSLGSVGGGVAPHFVYRLAVAGPVLFLVAVAFFWTKGGARVFELAQELFAYAFGVSALFGMMVLVQFAWAGWQSRSLNDQRELHRHTVVGTSGPKHGRVVWILLDELSYQQLYESRFPGLKLPAFDRLAAESTVFTHVVPISTDTAKVIPSLLTGIPTKDLAVTGDGKLARLLDARTGSWQTFDPHKTVFQDAIDQGYSTGVAGWYNPYCRILPSVLDHCAWANQMPLHGHMYSRRSAVQNVIGPWTSVVLLAKQELLRQKSPLNPDVERTAAHIADYQELASDGDNLLRDSSSDFIFLHMPFPHPGGMFDRRENKLTLAQTSYIDNLALADQYLAHVRQLLDQRGEWDSSTVVVMGDHSWRTKIMWVGTPDWTAEDELASHGGQFDTRPAYIVKLPGQTSAATIDTPYKAIRTRALMGQFLTGQVKTVDELKAWVGSGGN